MLTVSKKRKVKYQENPVLRQHQNDALTQLVRVIRSGDGKGRIVLPTGTGKTMTEVETVKAIIEKNEKEGLWPGVHVVLSPRILLAYQQLDEFLSILSKYHIECDYFVVNSGGLNSAEYEKKLLGFGFDNPEEIGSTTTVSEIVNQIESSRKKNRPLLIFSTYHSVDRVKSAAEEVSAVVESYIFDEAQASVSRGEFRHVPEFPARFKFFFTATEKVTDDSAGLGMNNENKFGKLLFSESPKTLIARGEMTSIAIHLVGTRGANVEDNDYESMAKVVIDAFEKHRIAMKYHSFMPDEIGPKMIVVSDKQDSLRGIMQSKTLKAFKLENQEVNLCALSSDFGIEVNGEKTPRANNKDKELLLKKMRAWTSKDEAIILHVDMIAEGLDIKGITAVMPFRGLGKIKFMQNTGRGTRLVDEDRRRLYSGGDYA